jgi:hypothetical protein
VPRRSVSRVDRGLRFLQSSGMRRGVRGGSRGWLWVFFAAWGARRFRRIIGSETVLVYRGELKPGETLKIDHLAQTYQGKPVRRRTRARQ